MEGKKGLIVIIILLLLISLGLGGYIAYEKVFLKESVYKTKIDDISIDLNGNVITIEIDYDMYRCTVKKR